MVIKRLIKSYKNKCGFCGRETILRYKVYLTKNNLDICTLCFEEQEEYCKIAENRLKKLIIKS